jgi:hypothetical protein
MSNRIPARRKNARALAMPDQTGFFLMVGAGVIFSLYIALVIITITLATWQTSLAAEVRETEGSITTLETTYYEALARQNAESPAAVGLVHPTVVEYAVARESAGISFAGN